MNQLNEQSQTEQVPVGQNQYNVDLDKAINKTNNKAMKSNSCKESTEKQIEPVTPYYVLGYN